MKTIPVEYVPSLMAIGNSLHSEQLCGCHEFIKHGGWFGALDWLIDNGVAIRTATDGWTFYELTKDGGAEYKKRRAEVSDADKATA